MTEQHESEHVRTGPLPARTARELVVAIEQLGVDSALLDVDTTPAIGTDEVGQVDRRTMTRPARRVALGVALGAVLALGVGLIAIAIWPLEVWAVILLSLIVGASLGGLWALYSRLAASVEATDLDSGHWSVVEASVGDLEADKASKVRQLLRDADQSARQTPPRQGMAGGAL